jgi:MFS family permease
MTAAGTRDEAVVDERWLTPGVRGIGGASLLADLGHEIPTALLPSFLTSTLGAPAAALGAIEGVADGLAGASRFAGGALADDPGRRRATAVGGYASTAVLTGLIGTCTQVWQVGVLRAAGWTARGLRVPARNALLADVVAPSAYGRAYGFERAMDNLGAVGGPLLALLLVSLVSVRTAILLSIVPGVLAVAAIVYAIRRTPRPTVQDRKPVRIVVRPLLRGAMGRLMTAIAVFEFGNIAATLLILRATDALEPEHGIENATQIALLLYTAYNLAATVVSIPAGRSADRSGAVRVLAAGVAAFAAAYLLFAVTDASIALLAVAFVFAGAGIGLVETAEHTAVAALAPVDLRGSAFGLLAATQSFGNLAASAVVGVVWTLASPGAALMIPAIAMLIALAVLAATTRVGPAS